MRPRSAAFAMPLLVIAGLPAQQVLTPASLQHGAILATRSGMVLPAGEFSVAELIEATARFLCRNYLYDLRTVEQVAGFTLQRPLALDALGSEEMLAALLAARGLAALPIDEHRGVHQVVALVGEAAQAPIGSVPWRSPDEILHRPQLRELVNTTVQLRHADANLIAEALRGWFALQGMWRPGQPTASASGRHLLWLHGYRDDVAAAIAAIRQAEQLLTPSATPGDAALLQRIERLERELEALRTELRAQRQNR